MRSDALSNLAKIGKIKAEPMNRSEIDRILTMARKRLEDAGYSSDNFAFHVSCIRAQGARALSSLGIFTKPIDANTRSATRRKL